MVVGAGATHSSGNEISKLVEELTFCHVIVKCFLHALKHGQPEVAVFYDLCHLD